MDLKKRILTEPGSLYAPVKSKDLCHRFLPMQASYMHKRWLLEFMMGVTQ